MRKRGRDTVPTEVPQRERDTRPGRPPERGAGQRLDGGIHGGMSTTISTTPSTPGLEPDDRDDGFAVIGRTTGIRALARNVSGVVDEVVKSGMPMILTKHGRPIAAIVPLHRADTDQ